MNAMNLIRQLMASKNPNAMIQNLAQSNPKIAQAIPVVEEIMKTSCSKKEVIEKACKKANMDSKKVEEQLKSIGLDI